MILTRTYERDYSGLVTKINRPGGRYTRYCYDKLGRVIRADYYDKTYENFTYDKNGALIEAENQYGKVKFERDSLGRITKEWQGRQFFYDEEGNLAKKIEPDGGTWTYLYFGNGMLREVTRPDKSCVSFQYDTFGRRIEKSVTSIHSKGVSEGRQ